MIKFTISVDLNSIDGIENERKQVKNEELIAMYFRSANDSEIIISYFILPHIYLLYFQLLEVKTIKVKQTGK